MIKFNKDELQHLLDHAIFMIKNCHTMLDNMRNGNYPDKIVETTAALYMHQSIAEKLQAEVNSRQ